MKKQLLITLSLIALLSSCSTEEEVDRPSFKALSFETFVGKGTPTRAVAKTDFAEGDDFGVIGSYLVLFYRYIYKSMNYI